METYAATDLRSRRAAAAPWAASGPGASAGWSGGGGGASSGAGASWGASAHGDAGGAWNGGGYGNSMHQSYSASYGGNGGYGASAGGAWGGGAAGNVGSADVLSGGNGVAQAVLTGPHAVTFVVLLVTAACLHAESNLAAPNLSAIAEDFQLTPEQKDTRLGGMVQFGFFLIGGGVALLVGPLTDQLDRVTLLSMVCISGGLPSFCMSFFVPSSKAGFFYFFLSRICTGIAIGGSFPVMFALAADTFPSSQRGFVSMTISAATNIGAAIGGMLAGIVGPSLGWRMPFRFVSIASLACAALVRVVLVDPRTLRRQKGSREEAVANNASSAWLGGEDLKPANYFRMEDVDLRKFARILHVRCNLLIFLQSMPGCMPIAVITTFLSDYLSVEQGMDVRASTLVTAIFGVSCLCFAVGGAVVGQQIFEKRKEQLPMLIGATMAIAAFPFLMLVNAPGTAVTSSSGRPTFLALFLALWGGSAAVVGPNIRSILLSVNDAEVSGTVFSALTLTDGFGKGIGPFLIAMATMIFGRRGAYTISFMCWFVSGAILFTLRSEVARDAARGGGSVLPFKNN